MTDLLYFEDFRAGQSFALETHTITEEEIIAFAREFDPQTPACESEAARQSMLGGLAASGWHLCALAMRMIVDGLFSRAASLGAPGVEEVQWRRPVRAGDALRFDCEVLETRGSSRPERGFVRFRFSMWRAKQTGEDERVMMFTCSVMFGRRASAGSA